MKIKFFIFFFLFLKGFPLFAEEPPPIELISINHLETADHRLTKSLDPFLKVILRLNAEKKSTISEVELALQSLLEMKSKIEKESGSNKDVVTSIKTGSYSKFISLNEYLSRELAKLYGQVVSDYEDASEGHKKNIDEKTLRLKKILSSHERENLWGEMFEILLNPAALEITGHMVTLSLELLECEKVNRLLELRDLMIASLPEEKVSPFKEVQKNYKSSLMKVRAEIYSFKNDAWLPEVLKKPNPLRGIIHLKNSPFKEVPKIDTLDMGFLISGLWSGRFQQVYSIHQRDPLSLIHLDLEEKSNKNIFWSRKYDWKGSDEKEPIRIGNAPVAGGANQIVEPGQNDSAISIIENHTGSRRVSLPLLEGEEWHSDPLLDEQKLYVIAKKSSEFWLYIYGLNTAIREREVSLGINENARREPVMHLLKEGKYVSMIVSEVSPKGNNASAITAKNLFKTFIFIFDTELNELRGNVITHKENLLDENSIKIYNNHLYLPFSPKEEGFYEFYCVNLSSLEVKHDSFQEKSGLRFLSIPVSGNYVLALDKSHQNLIIRLSDGNIKTIFHFEQKVSDLSVSEDLVVVSFSDGTSVIYQWNRTDTEIELQTLEKAWEKFKLKDSRKLPFLLQQLQSSNRVVRHWGANLLVNMGLDVVPILIQRLKWEGDPLLQSRINYVLMAMLQELLYASIASSIEGDSRLLTLMGWAYDQHLDLRTLFKILSRAVQLSISNDWLVLYEKMLVYPWPDSSEFQKVPKMLSVLFIEVLTKSKLTNEKLMELVVHYNNIKNKNIRQTFFLDLSQKLPIAFWRKIIIQEMDDKDNEDIREQAKNLLKNEREPDLQGFMDRLESKNEVAINDAVFRIPHVSIPGLGEKLIEIWDQLLLSGTKRVEALTLIAHSDSLPWSFEKKIDFLILNTKISDKEDAYTAQCRFKACQILLRWVKDEKKLMEDQKNRVVRVVGELLAQNVLRGESHIISLLSQIGNRQIVPYLERYIAHAEARFKENAKEVIQKLQ